MPFGYAEGKTNCTDADPWKQPYIIMNKTRSVSFFVYRRKSWDRFRKIVPKVF